MHMHQVSIVVVCTEPGPSPLQRVLRDHLSYIKIHVSTTAASLREYLLVRAETTNLVIK